MRLILFSALSVVIVEGIGATLIVAVIGAVIAIGGGLPVRTIPKILFYIFILF